MSKKVVVRVHGKNATFEIYDVKATFSNTSYQLYRNDKYVGTYGSRADAVRKAYEKAGDGAYES
jgi:hypothetical protein